MAVFFSYSVIEFGSRADVAVFRHQGLSDPFSAPFIASDRVFMGNPTIEIDDFFDHLLDVLSAYMDDLGFGADGQEFYVFDEEERGWFGYRFARDPQGEPVIVEVNGIEDGPIAPLP